jgi:pimeloyl-ACP methyl ester carboxylesterase
VDAVSIRSDVVAVNSMLATRADRPPSTLALLAEWPRAAFGLGELAALWPGLRRLPRGDGRPVLVLPGLVNSDRSNLVMRALLRRLGYRVWGWGLGRNLGARTIGAEGERLIDRIAAIHRETGEKVTLVGISLGGIMSRIAAHRRPDLVREVITISAPFAGPPSATNVWRPFEWLTGERITDAVVAERLEEAVRPLPVPSTAIWSRSDGLVNGLICRTSEGRAVEVRSSHLFVQMRVEVLRAVAGVLAGDAGARHAR